LGWSDTCNFAKESIFGIQWLNTFGKAIFIKNDFSCKFDCGVNGDFVNRRESEIDIPAQCIILLDKTQLTAGIEMDTIYRHRYANR